MILVLRLQIRGLMVGCCNLGFLGRVQVLINWFWDIVWHRRQFSPMSIMVGKHGSGTKEDPPFWIPTSPLLSHCWSCINFGIASAVREEERLERTKMVFFFSSFFVNADHVLLWGVEHRRESRMPHHPIYINDKKNNKVFIPTPCGTESLYFRKAQ